MTPVLLAAASASEAGGLALGALCCNLVALVAFVALLRSSGVGWLLTLGAAAFPFVFGWVVGLRREYGALARWLCFAAAGLQTLGLALGLGLGAATLVWLGQPGAVGEERRALYREGFVRRCAFEAPAPACECVADAAFDGSRDDDELRRLAFRVETGALARFRDETLARCWTAAASGSLARPGELDPGLGLVSTCRVQSTPPGAQVRVDGELVGVTPLEVKVLAGRRYRLEVALDGFFPQAREVERNANDDVELTFALEPAARLTVTTTPPGAAVRVRGELAVASTPGTSGPLEAGLATVQVALPGHQLVTRQVELAADASLDLTLSPGRTVRVSSTPVPGEVKLDGVPQGRTPLDVVFDPRRRPTLTVERPGWSTFKRSLARAKEGERVVARLVDEQLVAAKKRLLGARAAHDALDAKLEKLQARVVGLGESPLALERELVATERAMQQAVTRLEAAEAALRALEARRAEEARADARP